jgi:hypothetical protein
MFAGCAADFPFGIGRGIPGEFFLKLYRSACGGLHHYRNVHFLLIPAPTSSEASRGGRSVVSIIYAV